MKFKMTSNQLIVIVALYLVLFDNISFFKHVTQVYDVSVANSGFLLSLGIVLSAIITVFISLFSSRYTLKPLAIAFVLIASLTNYFMNTYNVILDDTMIQNAMETNANESLDLINLKLLGYFFFLGVIPSFLIYRVPVLHGSFKQEAWNKVKSIGIALVLIAVMLFAFNRFYTSFFRENKPLRYYTNPTYCLYSAGSYIYNSFYNKEATLKQIGLDATKEEGGARKLTIVVVGEAARANR
jgi:lipid A ethanolaminephosphotransferase